MSVEVRRAVDPTIRTSFSKTDLGDVDSCQLGLEGIVGKNVDKPYRRSNG
jgi:hypothetical protein